MASGGVDVSDYREEELLSGSEDPESSEDGAEEIFQSTEATTAGTGVLVRPPSANSIQTSTGNNTPQEEDKAHGLSGGPLASGSSSSSPREPVEYQR